MQCADAAGPGGGRDRGRYGAGHDGRNSRQGRHAHDATCHPSGLGPRRWNSPPGQQAHLVERHATGEHTIADLAELFSVSRATVYRVLERAGRQEPSQARPRCAVI
ncbi:helix-turn-helix domain-containing protein [Streptomyces sp. NPDC052052]|uniref:helix-turn-helix domain-containing protein n=1 Tax=Streptomyces sp. NPDC052052 TaxID=3154756 RepID=UPI00343D1C49